LGTNIKSHASGEKAVKYKTVIRTAIYLGTNIKSHASGEKAVKYKKLSCFHDFSDKV